MRSAQEPAGEHPQACRCARPAYAEAGIPVEIRVDEETLLIRGAKEHNLRDIDLELPRFKLVVITGVSGSGKSSLAFDTLYAEGQRRYVESLSAYARQFIGQMEKPRVDYIGGLSPAIAIEQKAVSRNPRSTVATVTEVYDYLRVLYARIGTPHCPQCGREVRAQSVQEIVEQVSALEPGAAFNVLAPVARSRKGTFEDVLAKARADGFARVRMEGQLRRLDDDIVLDKNKRHDIDLVVDRLAMPQDGDPALQDHVSRLTDSIETALEAGDGMVVISRDGADDWLLSERNACPDCGISFPELTPAMFSFNSPVGMCTECNGLGTRVEFDPGRFVDPELSINEGAVKTWGEVRKKRRSGAYRVGKQITERYGFDLDTPWQDLSEDCRNAILYGGERVVYKSEREKSRWEGEWVYEGTVNAVRRRYRQTKSDGSRRWYETFMSQQECPACGGRRLRPESLAVLLGGKPLDAVTALSIGDALDWVENLRPLLTSEQLQIGDEVLHEVRERLRFLMNVGLHYLTLDRPARSLSGGEGQRIRLASQIGCGLVGVLYVLDEPSIGLHSRDNRRLLDTLERLRDMGNSVVVVEHDEETMRTADWIVDLGPGAGINGGRVVAAGPPGDIEQHPESLTGRYLRAELAVTSPQEGRRSAGADWIVLEGVRQNNLKGLDVRLPIGLFTCVTGVSGSGKSSLVAQTLYPALAKALHRSSVTPGEHARVRGLEHIGKVVNITQSPIGRTPRSNPATYVQVMGPIRELFAKVPDSRVRGYKPGRFSFNVKGGRCEACKGHGQKRVEMHFLPDVWVTCNVCEGKRFNSETLQIAYKNRNISEVLDMDIAEALDFFGNVPRVVRKLKTLDDVGLGYVKLGQSATTLSGGEAQRVKLSKELARVATGDTLYILDEPTTGLHFADIQKLLDVLHRLTDAGNTVVVIEHNLDVIKTADYIIDLGPEGGDDGGYLVAEGTPEEVAAVPQSYTGQFLTAVL